MLVSGDVVKEQRVCCRLRTIRRAANADNWIETDHGADASEKYGTRAGHSGDFEGDAHVRLVPY